MPGLSFKPQFEPRIRAGAKRHSIRGKRKRPWREGDRLFLWVAQRTANRKWIGYTTVSMVEDVDIDLDSAPFRLRIRVDGEPLSDSEADQLARSDGFKNMRGMYEFWLENNEMPFAGDIIHWRFPLQPRPVDKPRSRQSRQRVDKSPTAAAVGDRKGKQA